jgi:hypothetical protein
MRIFCTDINFEKTVVLPDSGTTYGTIFANENTTYGFVYQNEAPCFCFFVLLAGYDFHGTRH